MNMPFYRKKKEIYPVSQLSDINFYIVLTLNVINDCRYVLFKLLQDLSCSNSDDFTEISKKKNATFLIADQKEM